MILHACFKVSESDFKNSWYIDSGATSHMCSRRNFFTELDEQHKGQVAIANGQKLTTFGIGTGYLKCKRDSQYKTIKVTDVLYVPQLEGNLLSVRKLTAKGLKLTFEHDSCRVMNATVRC
jgi:hypothetical protein